MDWQGRGGIYSSIWLLREEAGVVGFVVVSRVLPCAWLLFVCKTERWCCMVVWVVLGRGTECFAR